jgi:hypothetical protein
MKIVKYLKCREIKIKNKIKKEVTKGKRIGNWQIDKGRRNVVKDNKHQENK